MRRGLLLCLTVLLVTLFAGSFVAAQQPTSPGPAPNVGISRSYWFEICLVVVLVGGALWAVCRSSNRQ